MGNMLDCERIEGTYRVPGRVTLETDLLEFRGMDVRDRVKLEDIVEVTASGGILSVKHGKRTLHLDLGEQAERWAQRLLHPPSRLDKLGIRRGDWIQVVGSLGDDFEAELAGLDIRLDSPQPMWILYASPSQKDLNTLPAIGNARGLWVIYPRKDVREADVLQAGRSAGLVDTKVMRFSPTQTALKFVTRKKKPIPTPP